MDGHGMACHGRPCEEGGEGVEGNVMDVEGEDVDAPPPPPAAQSTEAESPPPPPPPSRHRFAPSQGPLYKYPRRAPGT